MGLSSVLSTALTGLQAAETTIDVVGKLLLSVRDRLDLEEADAQEVEALGAEGLEVSVPARGSVRVVVHEMLKHLCSAISYGGASSLRELQEAFRAHPERYLVPLSAAGRTESFQR